MRPAFWKLSNGACSSRAGRNKIVRDILDEMAVINENEGMLADGSWIRKENLSV